MSQLCQLVGAVAILYGTILLGQTRLVLLPFSTAHLSMLEFSIFQELQKTLVMQLGCRLVSLALSMTPMIFYFFLGRLEHGVVDLENSLRFSNEFSRMIAAGRSRQEPREKHSRKTDRTLDENRIIIGNVSTWGNVSINSR